MPKLFSHFWIKMTCCSKVQTVSIIPTSLLWKILGMNSHWRLPSNNFMKLSRLLDGEANIECNMQNHPNLCKTTWNHPEPSNMSILACIFHLLWKKTLQKKKGWINTLFSFIIMPYLLNMGLRSHQTFLQPKKYQGRRNFPLG